MRKTLRGKLLRLVAGAMPPDRPAPMVPRNLLFLRYATALGTAVNATPLFEAVKAACPDSVITVIAAGLPYQVLNHNPFIDRLIAAPDAHDHFVRAAWHVATFVRGGAPYDCCVSDCGNMQTRIALLALLSRARRRMGFTLAPELYHRALSRDPGLSVRDDNMRLTEILGFGRRTGEPRVYFSQAERDAVERMLARHGIGDEEPLILLVTQTSGGQPSRWFDDRFAAVADALALRHGAAIAFVGTAGEADGIESIRWLMTGPSVSLAGQTDLSTLSALLCRADLVLSLDTGPMHLARAVEVPTVVVAPAWQPAYEWLPLGVPSCRIVRRDDIPCRECRKFFCATHECMDEIGVDAVIAAVEAHLAAYPVSRSRREQRLARSMVPSAG